MHDASGKFEILDPLQQPNWDGEVLAHGDSSIFHSSAWARVLHQTYGYKPAYLCWRGESGFVRILPLMEVNSPITGKRGVSLPFTDQCEPLGVERGQFQEVCGELQKQGQRRGWKYWELRGNGPSEGSLRASISFYTHSLDLTAGAAKIFAGFESSVRRAIRKGEKSGLNVEVDQSEHGMREFFALQCKTRKRHGLPPQPLAFFLNLHRHLISKDLGFLIIARHDRLPVASLLFLRWGRKAVYKFGASDERFQALRGSNAVMWEAIRNCIKLGLEQLNFGRTSLENEGLRRFKLGWGTAEQNLSYFRFDLRKNEFVSTTDRALGWHNRLFAALPPALLRLTGKILYPHLG